MIKLIFVIITFTITTVNAKNYFVDPLNGSMLNNGSFSKPWSTLSDVMSEKHFSDGDTLFLRSGFHGKNVIVKGSQISNIVIIAEKGELPQILHMTICGKNVVVSGLLFTAEGNYNNGTPRFFDNGILVKLDSNSSNNVIKNCNFQSVEDASKWTLKDWRSKVWSGIRDFGKSNSFVRNKFKNIAYAIELNRTCRYSLVSKNTIEDFSGDGIRIGGADFCIIEHNIIKNSIELDSNTIVGNHEDGIQAWVEKGKDNAVEGVIVRGNYILNFSGKNKPFKGIFQGIGFFDGPFINCVFENNVVIVEHFHGITLFGAYNCKIINNTVLPYPGTFPYIAGPPWIGIFAHKDGTHSNGNIVRNNLTSNIILEKGSAVSDHNLVDPVAFKFVKDYKHFDFRPKPDFSYGGRTIIDSGSSEDAPQVDIEGVSRPQGKGFDIGAYELIVK